MKRLLVTVALLAVALLTVLWPVLGTGSDSESSAAEDTRITSYQVRYDVSESGRMAAVERLVVDVPISDKHGIFRFWDTFDRANDRTLRVPEQITVTRDGSPEKVSITTENRGRYVVAKIGDPVTTLTPGLHTYEITYTVGQVLSVGPDDTARFYWDLVPGGWAQRIDLVDAEVRFPASFSGAECAVGSGSGSPCSIIGEGSSTLSVFEQDLDPRTPVTVRAEVDTSVTNAPDELPWPARWVPVLGSSVLGLMAVLVAVGVAGFLGWRMRRATIERTPSFPLQYVPPAGVGPAQAGYLLTERSTGEHYVGNLMFAAQHDWLDLERVGNGWVVQGRPDMDWSQVDPVTRTQAVSLGLSRGGRLQTADGTSGKRLSASLSQTNAAPKVWATRSGLVARAGVGALALLLLLLAVGVFVVLLAIQASPLVLAFIPAAFIVCAWPMVLLTSWTKRTESGRDLWSRIGGFHRVLSTPSSQERFDFSGREELYTAYIPWAVAFGCADVWAEKYRTETGSMPPDPVFLGGGLGYGSTSGITSMAGDFSSTVSSAISSYEASQSSSSSGGGFSGGGGGGGVGRWIVVRGRPPSRCLRCPAPSHGAP